MWEIHKKRRIRKGKGSLSTVLLIDIDNGLTWNPSGKVRVSKDKGVGWVWCHPDQQIPQNFLSSLNSGLKTWKSITPVFYSTCPLKIAKDICNQIVPDVSENVWFILDVKSIEELKAEIEVLKNSSEPTEYLVFGKDINLEDAGCVPEKILPNPDKGLVILIGQSGSGKTKYAEFLRSKGYWYVSPKEAEHLWFNRDITVQRFKEAVSNFLDQKIPGIVIDSCNSRKKRRDYYLSLCDSKIPVINVLITKPGFDQTSNRSYSVPDICLFTYADKLEIPENFVRGW